MVTPVATSDKLLEHKQQPFWQVFILTKTNWALRCSIYLPVNFFAAEGDEEYIDKLLQSLKPAEVVFQRSNQKHFKEVFWIKVLHLHAG